MESDLGDGSQGSNVLQNVATFRQACSRLYRSRFLQVNIRCVAFFNLYRICALLHHSNINDSQKIVLKISGFGEISVMSAPRKHQQPGSAPPAGAGPFAQPGSAPAGGAGPFAGFSFAQILEEASPKASAGLQIRFFFSFRLKL